MSCQFFCIFVLTLCFQIISSCKHENDIGRVKCASFDVLDKPGNYSNWTHVIFKNSGNEDKKLLPNNTFRALKLVENLKIIGLINKLEKDSFRGLINLEKLDLIDNELEELPIGVFDDLPVKTITIVNSKLKDLKNGYFNNVPRLEIVGIRENKIETVPADVFKNSTIKYIDLSVNSIKSIEDCAFCNMSNLSHLFLNFNKLKSFEPSRILGQSTISGIGLDENQLTEIPRFDNTPNLLGVTFMNNSISAIADNSFALCKKLQLVDFSNNRLKDIPANIFPDTWDAVEPYFLIIHNNNIECVSKEVRNKIKSLRRITVEDNPWRCECLSDVISWARGLNADVACETQHGLCLVPCVDSQNRSRNITINN